MKTYQQCVSGSGLTGDEFQYIETMAVSDHDAEIAARDARIAELERELAETEQAFSEDNTALGKTLLERDALQQRISNALTDLKAIRGELYGIGKESSHEFHRIGVESALGITKRAIASLSPPPSTEGESA